MLFTHGIFPWVDQLYFRSVPAGLRYHFGVPDSKKRENIAEISERKRRSEKRIRI